MAQHKQAEKRARQTVKKESRNRHHKTTLANALKKIRALTSKKDGEKLLSGAISVIDKSVSLNILHKNTANRYKSRLSNYINSLGK
jgi:small subunit ribosomal protein S20